MEKLQPYYSPTRENSEEYYYEVLSFVAIQAAKGDWLQPSHLAWAARCTNTAERLQHAYEWMWSHVLALRQEVAMASQELMDCREECQDLW